MSHSGQSLYQTQSAILFIVFNRPDTTSQVFAEIKNARPAKLYIAADGPRDGKPGETELCEQTRAIVSQIDWDCQLTTLFRDTNQGCKNAVSEAITWFFEYEAEGIILEDDCLPHNCFFKFCDELLARYRDDKRVSMISGCNFQQGHKRGTANYYFSNLSHVWGWASWRRVWQDYDKELNAYTTDDARQTITNIFNEPLITDSWVHIFEELKAGRIDTWDYQLAFLNFFKGRLSIIPNQNLISNIGFGENATHTTQASPNANIPLVPLTGLQHPDIALPATDADKFTLDTDFNIAARKRKQNSWKYKLKRLIKGK
jgi:hypothetical protein